jgi:hypothetical protein
MRVLACLSAGILAGLCGAELSQAQTGTGFQEVHMHRGQPYLTVEAVQRAYGFTDLRGDAGRFELSSATARLEGRAGDSFVLLNNLRYELHHPLEVGERQRLVSAYDLSNLIDFLFRPAGHLHGGELKTVYLQTDSADGLAAKPVAAEVVLNLQTALSQFGFAVRSVPADAVRVGSGALPGGGDNLAVWLKLRGNPKLPADSVRCAVLSPPDSPKREANRTEVYAGNLADAGSLALATLLQSGLVFGPGAKVRKVTDGGIAQDLGRSFQAAPGPAVLVEWGKEFSRDHLLKSLAAGVVRYQAFLRKLPREPARGEGKAVETPFRLEKLRITSGPQGAGIAGAVSGVSSETDRGKIQLQWYFFEVAPSGALKLLQTPPPLLKGAELVVGPTGEEPAAFFQPLSGELEARLRQPDTGYAVRLLWQGKEQDLASHPPELRNQLERFSALYPQF